MLAALENRYTLLSVLHSDDSVTLWQQGEESVTLMPIVADSVLSSTDSYILAGVTCNSDQSVTLHL